MKNEDIAKKVRETRKIRGLTQSDIAKVLDKTSATVSDMERGKIQISASDLFKIANVLNKPIEYFFGDEFGNENIQDLIFLIRKQPIEQQDKIVQQTKMLLSLTAFQESIYDTGRELSDQEISDALNYVFQYADDIEKIHNQMVEIRKNLREAFKSHGINGDDVLET